MFRASIALLLVGVVTGQVQDQTRVPGAHGPDVVQAVVSQIRESCFFPDDKLFLRRLAFVETHDGDDPKTYRAGYYGGIWQIDQNSFNQLKSNSKATALFAAIKAKFAIDWNTVQWSDLRKPLYSGLAAALFLTTITEEVPRLMESQGPYYGKYFRTGTDSAHNFYVAVKGFNYACLRTNLDLAFIVDASASLSNTDFNSAKMFAHDVVENFKIGPEDVRIAFVTFSTGYHDEFNFNKYTDKDALKKAIDGIAMIPGATDTDKALYYAANTLFTSTMGSRDGTSKIILLVTDGKSTHPLQTIPAAQLARSKGIIIYTIGVGSDVDVGELKNVANAPYCTHVIQLAGYSDLSALVSAIQQVSCESAAVLAPGTYTSQCSTGGIYQIQTNGTTTQVTVTVTDGKVDIYGSLDNPTPSQALNSFHTTASVPTSSVVLVDQEYKPVYLTIKATGGPNGCTGTYTIKVGPVERVKANTLVTCVVRDNITYCSIPGLYGYMYTLLSPPYNFNNPCQPGVPSFRPHPLDQTKFLYCDANGKVYVFQCPFHNIYDKGFMYCVPGEATTLRMTTAAITTQLPIFPGGNPCNEANRHAGNFLFAYKPDETKYIDCTNWPTLGIIKDCAPFKVWDQLDLTCVYRLVVINATGNVFNKDITNPCRNPLKDSDLFFYTHPTDKHKFIHCDQFGQAFEKTCPSNQIWSEEHTHCGREDNVVG